MDTNQADHEPYEDEDDIAEDSKEEWSNQRLEGDMDRQADQLVALAKARFHRMLKESFDRPAFKAASRKKKKTSNQRVAAKAIDAFADVSGLSLDQLAMMQLACLTQGVVDCSTRAALQSPPGDDDNDSEAGASRFTSRVPGDARRSQRHAELFDATHLAYASARLMETVARYNGEGSRHAFTYEHLHRHVAATVAEQGPDGPEEAEKTSDERAASLTDMMFEGIKLTPAPIDTPSPSTKAP
jgi:hypothetical protein